MRYSTSEKFEFIRLVEQPSLSVRQTLLRLYICRPTFYGWLKRYQQDGVNGREDRIPSLRSVWDELPQDQVTAIIELALKSPNCH